jgi:D-2-hydroxyglutarate dehydrogenase
MHSHQNSNIKCSFGLLQQTRHHSQLSKSAKVCKDTRFASISDEDIVELGKIVGDKGIFTDESYLESANTDWMRKYVGSSKVLLRPKTTEQVVLRAISSL